MSLRSRTSSEPTLITKESVWIKCLDGGDTWDSTDAGNTGDAGDRKDSEDTGDSEDRGKMSLTFLAVFHFIPCSAESVSECGDETMDAVSDKVLANVLKCFG